jgi:hypothetical protein
VPLEMLMLLWLWVPLFLDVAGWLSVTAANFRLPVTRHWRRTGCGFWIASLRLSKRVRGYYVETGNDLWISVCIFTLSSHSMLNNGSVNLRTNPTLKPNVDTKKKQKTKRIHTNIHIDDVALHVFALSLVFVERVNIRNSKRTMIFSYLPPL